MSHRAGKHSILLDIPPYLGSCAVVAGPKEGQGPLGAGFDLVYEDLLAKQKSFEAAERKMLGDACALALNKGNYRLDQIDYFLAGDLLNQITVSGYSAANLALPFIGLYGACSTLALSLALSAMLISGGFASNILAATSSHNCSSERQFRYPTEYGFQRPPQAQWTVTGAGAAVVTGSGSPPRITAVTLGRVVDFSQKDPLGLGIAMAPAAASTLIFHFRELERNPGYYDLIVTGDLGKLGMSLNKKLLSRAGYHLEDNYNDCGMMIYNLEAQQADSGGSGCACSALVFLGHLIKKMQAGELSRVLLVSTGALHSPTTLAQGENIPCIAHAVAFEM